MLVLAMMKQGFSYSEILEMDEAEYYAFAGICFPVKAGGLRVKTYKTQVPG
jgi:hypothetical protein